ncbi:MAG: mobile mystery protein A [Flavobacteriales bacterium]|nr:mobile mystery protein A [Flavobacteriales bacterium]
MSKLLHLRLRQLDQQLQPLVNLPPDQPQTSWLATIRDALGMPLNAFAARLGMTPTGAKAVERREAEGTITLQVLRKAADAMDMRLVYALVPKDGSLEKMIERRALIVAKELVMRTHQTMKLEGQAVSDERLNDAIAEKAEELRREMPKQLWR